MSKWQKILIVFVTYLIMVLGIRFLFDGSELDYLIVCFMVWIFLSNERRSKRIWDED